MLVHGAMLWHACLRSFLGELGDKTFFLTVILAVWCPWDGIRGGSEHSFQLAMVFAGSLAALLLRVALASAGLGALPTRDNACEATACIVLTILGLKAKIELDRADAKAAKALGERSPLKGGGAETEAADEPVKWNTAAFASAPPAPKWPEPPAYGTLQPASPADGILSEPLGDKLVSHVLAFVAPLALGFALEAEDKSSGALAAIHRGGSPSLALGAALGLVPAVAAAVGLGYVAGRQMSDQRLLFLAVVGLLALSLVSLSQALAHLGAANFQPSAAREVVASFLSLVRGR